MPMRKNKSHLNIFFSSMYVFVFYKIIKNTLDEAFFKMFFKAWNLILNTSHTNHILIKNLLLEIPIHAINIYLYYLLVFRHDLMGYGLTKRILWVQFRITILSNGWYVINFMNNVGFQSIRCSRSIRINPWFYVVS